MDNIQKGPENGRDKIRNLVGSTSDCVGIEIGALNRPIIKREFPGEIFYLDHLSTSDLKNKYAHDPTVDVEDIVKVHYVVNDGNIKKAVKEKKFDYVVAAHVVEHVPNPINWLQEIFDILKPEGVLYLLVPDKRFTFDFQRPVTTFGTMLESYLTGRDIPSVSAVYDHLASAVKIDGTSVWGGLLKEIELLPLAGDKQAFEQANKVFSKNEYIDVHHSIFTPASFLDMMEKIISSDLLYAEIDKFNDTKLGDIEFLVALKKPMGSSLKVKKQCLQTVPQLPLDSYITPYMPQVKALSSALESAISTQSFLQSEIEEGRIRYRNLEKKIEGLHSKISLMQRVLDRRSVKLTIAIMHFVFKKINLKRR